jgi:hypothetical protein
MLLLLHCYLRNGNRSWTNVVYLWIQEEPHGEYNNNKGTQIEHWSQVGVPHLYSSWMIINFVLKFMLEIIFVNMTKERKDMVKQKWIWNLNFGRRLMDLEFGYGSILYIYIKKNRPPMDLISWPRIGVTNDVNKYCWHQHDLDGNIMNVKLD